MASAKPSSPPPIEETDVGKVLGVTQDAEENPVYGLVEQSGGGNDFVITFSSGDDVETVTCDKTFAEIKAAHLAGKTLVCFYVIDAQIDEYYDKVQCNSRIVLSDSDPTSSMFVGSTVINGFTVVDVSITAEGTHINRTDLQTN